MLSQVAHRPYDGRKVVFGKAQKLITVTAKDAAHLLRLMVMVNTGVVGLSKGFMTDSTSSPLLFQKRIELLQCDAVAVSQSRLTVRHIYRLPVLLFPSPGTLLREFLIFFVPTVNRMLLTFLTARHVPISMRRIKRERIKWQHFATPPTNLHSTSRFPVSRIRIRRVV